MLICFKFSVGFLERQQRHIERIRSNSEERRRRIIQKESNEFFHPSICKKSAEMIDSLRGNETLSEMAERMSKESIVREKKREMKEQQYYGKLTFTPSLDPMSRALGRATSLEDLLWNPRGRKAREDAERKAEDVLRKQCTFRPHIRPSSAASLRSVSMAVDSSYEKPERSPGHWSCDDSCDCILHRYNLHSSMSADSLGTSSHMPSRSFINMKDPVKMSESIKAHMLEKEQRRQEALHRKELAELSECTFQPTPSKPAPSPQTARRIREEVPVRGLDGYLSLREQAEQRKREQRLREEQAFKPKGVEQARSSVHGCTIVKVR